MRPSEAYRQGAESGRWESDPVQLQILQELDRIYDELLERERGGALARLTRKLRRDTPVRGLYLWGTVGRGKTFLVDLFYSHLPLRAKHRIHFHRFMADVHERIRALGQHSDPLVKIAGEYAKEFNLLCLDEFFVTDIGDAMLLGRLLEQLFVRGVTLVTTSNTAPENLYKDGLQRASFLPAIILLQAHCHVVEVARGQDFRLRALTQASIWQTPDNAAAEAALQQCFTQLTPHHEAATGPATLSINDRPLPARAVSEDVVWFQFSDLCDGPRSVADYIELARRFHTVIVSGIPRFDRNNEDAAYRFVLLVDELYDRQVKLIASAATAPVDIYHGHRSTHEFERTISRLIEMQSEEYLARDHLP